MRSKSKKITVTAVIAALYAVMTLALAALGLAYGSVQFRISEALTALAAFNPYVVVGLTLGCALGNIASPFGVIDVLFGSAATLISSVLIRAVGRSVLRRYGISPADRKIRVRLTVIITAAAAFISAAVNGVLVGTETLLTTATDAPVPLFLTTVVSVAIGEISVCLVLCPLLTSVILRVRRLSGFLYYPSKRSVNGNESI